MVERRRDHTRGQLILVGAIALAFIILGVIVVFNGVLYTETISSGETSQSGATEEVTGLEIEQSVGCLLEKSDTSTELEAEVDDLNDAYRALTAHSSPAVTSIEITDADYDPGDGESVNVTITYDSHDFSYSQTREIGPTDENCPDDS
ncbi:DUF7261 family protein [Natronobacterium gregoryi]|uniref:Uncharacterized protein n=2 Tax=Natronobacterium gregoryi TaxID=44930 RepID=L0AFC3_NATGS|nr:hypothetical protein [Natronobacterium gregoryi]AFZ71760.1 hypothetical protein Natgr_0507 [Natronobacterium gregoryi SP2]ELY72855.1 hypothetical protein C490_02501 [Natronobacterium gregoryi SP2]PLK21059.1 hypothetical protein CYV19_06400 [Natronobacterium gregoryi SP2]SFI88446.1 hypothetical protein SAMN05443661_10863 [Natronobacterium gregoryi]